MYYTDKLSARYRARIINIEDKKILIANLSGSQQENDLTKPPNCKGYGRIRHFKRYICDGWPLDTLPIDPACKALKLSPPDSLQAQVFQIAACNFRCWYCFVPDNLICADTRYANWLGPQELVELYLNQDDPPLIIDLSGGQPDLTPEWVPWMMEELYVRGIQEKVYLWSDDNLSNDYLWRFLSDKDIDLMTKYPNYGRVCCFKGFNADSFSFNTGASPELFDRQFILFKRLLELHIDLYAYVTFTCRSEIGVSDDIKRFVDRLQEMDETLPLRTVPLKIQVFSPVKGRMDKVKEKALEIQQLVVEEWQKELESRFSADKRACISDNPIRRKS